MASSWSLANSISNKHGFSEMGRSGLLKKPKKINKHPQKTQPVQNMLC
jgi:hypothetical protein